MEYDIYDISDALTELLYDNLGDIYNDINKMLDSNDANDNYDLVGGEAAYENDDETKIYIDILDYKNKNDSKMGKIKLELKRIIRKYLPFNFDIIDNEYNSGLVIAINYNSIKNNKIILKYINESTILESNHSLKYDEEALCRAFDNIANPVISEIRKNVKKDIFSQIPKSAVDRFYTDYSHAKHTTMNSNYMISNSIIRKVIYFYEFDLYDHNNYVGVAIDKIVKLIKNSNIPFKYGVDVFNNDYCITIGIKISELLKLDSNIAKKSTVTKHDIFNNVIDCIDNQRRKINKGIENIIKTKKCSFLQSNLYFNGIRCEFDPDKNDAYISIIDVYLTKKEYTTETNNIINSTIQQVKSFLSKYIRYKYDIVLYSLYGGTNNSICIHIDTSMQYNIDTALSIINEAVQKYDEESIVKSAQKVLGKYIKEIQSKIDTYLSTQSNEVRHYIFKDYIAKGEDWYEGYTIYRYNNKIGLFVYFYNPYDDYNGVCEKVIPNVENIIKKAKLPIPFTIEYASDEQIPIEIAVKIDDLIKLDTSISRKSEISENDACDIVKEIVDNNQTKKYIITNLKKIIRKYKIDDICEVYDDIDVNGGNRSYNDKTFYIRIILIDYDVYTFSSRDPESPEFIKLMKSVYADIGTMLKQVIPFKFEIDVEWEECIVANIRYEDIKNHKDALKYIHETSTIFESVRFI